MELADLEAVESNFMEFMVLLPNSKGVDEPRLIKIENHKVFLWSYRDGEESRWFSMDELKPERRQNVTRAVVQQLEGKNPLVPVGTILED